MFCWNAVEQDICWPFLTQAPCGSNTQLIVIFLHLMSCCKQVFKTLEKKEDPWTLLSPLPCWFWSSSGYICFCTTSQVMSKAAPGTQLQVYVTPGANKIWQCWSPTAVNTKVPALISNMRSWKAETSLNFRETLITRDVPMQSLPGIAEFQCVKRGASPLVHLKVPCSSVSERPIQKYFSDLRPVRLIRKACSFLKWKTIFKHKILFAI